MNTIRFEWVVDRQGDGRIQPHVDGQRLIDLVRAHELPIATAEGTPTIAGAYGPLDLRRTSLTEDPRGHFLGGAESHLHCGPREKTVLLGCDCGEPGCWPLMARVEVGPRTVTWRAFEQPYREGWDYAGFGPFEFDRAQYEHALAELVRAIAGTPGP